MILSALVLLILLDRSTRSANIPPDLNKFNTAVRNCRKESFHQGTYLSDNDIEGLLSGNGNTPDTTCFLKCFYRDLGWMNDKDLVPQFIVVESFSNPNDENDRTFLRNQCINQMDSSKKPACHIAAHFHKCLLQLVDREKTTSPDKISIDAVSRIVKYIIRQIQTKLPQITGSKDCILLLNHSFGHLGNSSTDNATITTSSNRTTSSLNGTTDGDGNLIKDKVNNGDEEAEDQNETEDEEEDKNGKDDDENKGDKSKNKNEPEEDYGKEDNGREKNRRRNNKNKGDDEKYGNKKNRYGYEEEEDYEIHKERRKKFENDYDEEEYYWYDKSGKDDEEDYGHNKSRRRKHKNEQDTEDNKSDRNQKRKHKKNYESNKNQRRKQRKEDDEDDYEYEHSRRKQENTDDYEDYEYDNRGRRKYRNKYGSREDFLFKVPLHINWDDDDSEEYVGRKERKDNYQDDYEGNERKRVRVRQMYFKRVRSKIRQTKSVGGKIKLDKQEISDKLIKKLNYRQIHH